MGKTKKRPSTEYTYRKAVSNALVIMMWGFCQAFDPDVEKLEILNHEICSVRDSLTAGALTINDLRKALKDEYDLEVD